MQNDERDPQLTDQPITSPSATANARPCQQTAARISRTLVSDDRVTLPCYIKRNAHFSRTYYTSNHLTKSGKTPVRQSFASSAFAQPSRARIPLSATTPPTPADATAVTDPRLPPFNAAAAAAAATAAAASTVSCASFTASVRFSPASRAKRNIGVRPGGLGSKEEPVAAEACILS